MKPPNGIPDNAEFGLFRAWLAQHGFSQQQIKEAVGNKPNGRTRSEIAKQLSEWLENVSN